MFTRTGKSTVTMLAVLGIAAMVFMQVSTPTKAMDYKSLRPSLDLIDVHAVRAVVNNHFNGLIKGDLKLLESAWDENARVRSIRKGKDGKELIQNASATQLIKQWAAQPSPKTKGVIMSVDVVNGNMAVAKVGLNWNGTTLIDFLTLMKSNGKWQIVSKAFVEANKNSKKPSLYGLPG